MSADPLADIKPEALDPFQYHAVRYNVHIFLKHVAAVGTDEDLETLREIIGRYDEPFARIPCVAATNRASAG